MSTQSLRRIGDVIRLLRQAGPYVALEVLLPGGTLVALLLFLHRTGRLRNASDAASRAVERAAEGTFDPLAFAVGAPSAPVRRLHGGAARDGLAPLDLDSIRRLAA